MQGLKQQTFKLPLNERTGREDGLGKVLRVVWLLKHSGALTQA